MRPGAGERNIEMIAPAGGRKAACAARAGTAVRGDPVAVPGHRTYEPAAYGTDIVVLILPDAVDE
jgi:hypothetical protein